MTNCYTFFIICKLNFFKNCMKFLNKILIYLSKIQRGIKMESPDIKDSAYKSIKEGQAEVRLKCDKVFYNPVQEFNRDLSIAVLSVFTEDYREKKLKVLEKKRNNAQDIDKYKIRDGKEEKCEVPITILEALSATGLRSIRYAKEVPNVTKIVANDLSEQAVETIKDNIAHNGVENLVETSHDDACMLMYKHKHPAKRFTAIDLDPYGCPSTFLDAAVQSVSDGGLLLVTATDMAVLAGNSPETCYVKYGAVSLKTKCCHEMALRILLQCIESHANRYSRYIVPLLSISADFYIRVFVEVRTGAIHRSNHPITKTASSQCNTRNHPRTNSKLSMVYHCVGCGAMTLHPLGGFKPNPCERDPQQIKAYLPLGPPVGEHCIHCNQKHYLGGPIWSAAIHDEAFVTRVLQHVQLTPRYGTCKRLQGVLAMVREELPAPLYLTLDKLFGRVHCETMPMLTMRSAILNAGYKVSYSHAHRLSVKTAAPAQLIWDIVRTWEKDHPVKPAKKETDPIAGYILSQEIKSAVDLSERSDANPMSRQDGCLRFQYNPAPFWGPGSRAVVNMGEEKNSKSLRNQNKNKTKKRPRSPPTDDETRKKSTED